VCGDDEFNEAKLFNLFPKIRAGREDELYYVSGADAGSIGPLNLKLKEVTIIADLRLRDADELISGANKNDYHIRNIDLKRDVPDIRYEDIRISRAGERTADQKSVLREVKAIEVGHIFKLGTIFSERLGARFLDENGKEYPIIMGSYGIGVERIAAAYIEQNHDENGIIWGGEIAPFQIHLIAVNSRSNEVKSTADEIYDKLLKSGYEVLYDDREDVSAGFKFKDADLVGIPLQAVVSEKNIKNGEIELKFRRNGNRIKLSISDINSLSNYTKNL
jgi:prolyl-tRNA synthetase